jgi:hypothetical protein
VHERFTLVKLAGAAADAFLDMVGDRSRYGLCVSALGAIVLAASLFTPWYAPLVVAHAAGGTSAVRHLATVDAYHALPNLTVLLLVLDALAMLDVLAPLARGRGPVPGAAGGSVVLLGGVAAACVIFRMIDPPAFGADALALSLREGAWLALLGSATIALGGMWPGALSWN